MLGDFLKEYEEGFKASTQGVKSEQNPYQANSDQNYYWYQGWLNGQEGYNPAHVAYLKRYYAGGD